MVYILDFGPRRENWPAPPLVAEHPRSVSSYRRRSASLPAPIHLEHGDLFIINSLILTTGGLSPAAILLRIVIANADRRKSGQVFSVHSALRCLAVLQAFPIPA